MMKSISFSKFKSTLTSVLDKVIDTHEPVVIIRGAKKNDVVVISEEDYKSLQETLYLFSSKSNSNRLFNAIEKIDSNCLANPNTRGENC